MGCKPNGKPMDLRITHKGEAWRWRPIGKVSILKNLFYFISWNMVRKKKKKVSNTVRWMIGPALMPSQDLRSLKILCHYLTLNVQYVVVPHIAFGIKVLGNMIHMLRCPNCCYYHNLYDDFLSILCHTHYVLQILWTLYITLA